jgi:hypothetical protein
MSELGRQAQGGGGAALLMCVMCDVEREDRRCVDMKWRQSILFLRT